MNNFINIAGTLCDIKKSHTERSGQDIYSANVSMNIEKKHIKVPVQFKDNVKQVYNLKEDSHVNLYGELRTKNLKQDNDKSKLSVFAFITQGNRQVNNYNEVVLTGFVCKKSKIINKKSHNICSVIIAVKRNNDTVHDFIPCVGHNLNANLFRDMKLRTNIKVIGKFVNREYYDHKEQCTKTTYEVLVRDIQVLP